MSEITSTKNYFDFIRVCRFFRCKNPDVYGEMWDGEAEYIIASDTPEDELLTRFPDVMRALSPYLYCSFACGEAIAEGMRNTDKFQKRLTLVQHYSLDVAMEQGLEDLVCRTEPSDIEKADFHILIEEALELCTDAEKKRIIRYYIEGYTYRAIALGEGVSEASIRESIKNGIRKMKKFL